MKIHRMKIRDIGPFTDEVEIPFDQLGNARLVALHGDNGAGKSTTIECIPGALYRTTPSRGALTRMAGGKASLVELEIETDQRYRAQIQMDATQKTVKQAAYLYDEEGKTLADGKLRAFDAAIAERFPPLALVLSSIFAAQGGEGRFLSLGAAERKTLFVEMLGLGRLEEMAKAAGEHARAVELEVARLRERETHLAELSSGLGEIQAHHQGLVLELADVRWQIEEAEVDLTKTTAAREQWTARLAELERAEQQASHDLDGAQVGLDHARQDVAQAEQRRDEIDGRITGLEQRLENRARLESEAARVKELTLGVGIAEHECAVIRDAQQQYRVDREQWVERGQEARATVDRIGNAWVVQRERADRAAGEASKALRRAHEQARALEDVPCGGEGEYAACPLIAAALKSDSEIPTLTAESATLHRDREALRGEPSELLAAHDILDRLRSAAPVEPPDDTDQQAALDDTRKALADALEAATRLEALHDADEQRARLCAERGLTEHGLSVLADEVSAAVVRVAVAQASADRAHQALGWHYPDAPTAPDQSAMQRLRSCEADLIGKASATATRLENAEQASTDLEQAHQQATAEVADLDDWRHLRRALGKDGIQALEIDAAGPEVSGLINELLHSCYGGRFTVSLETTAMRADGKATKEVFDIRVIDTERGTELEARDLSGGEQVLVSEALSLALAIYNTQRNSIPMLDLWRDECSGALDSGHAVRYLEMLRRAIDLGGFHRCYFIAHQPELWGLADARLTFADGDVRVEVRHG